MSLNVSSILLTTVAVAALVLIVSRSLRVLFGAVGAPRPGGDALMLDPPAAQASQLDHSGSRVDSGGIHLRGQGAPSQPASIGGIRWTPPALHTSVVAC